MQYSFTKYSQYQASDFGKVAVLMGGWSAEREVSLNSGQAVLTALQKQGIDAQGVDADKNIYTTLKNNAYDRVFNMLHGPGGEDGIVQSVLELLALPYTGSGVMASALCMDKYRTKLLWSGVGLPTPEFMIIDSASDCERAIESMGLPLMIKPVVEGSSIGMTKVSQAGEIETAWQTASEYGVVLAEKWIEGDEYTAAVVNGVALPIIRLETKRTFYDYQAKYIDDDTQYHCPCGLSKTQEQACQKMILEAFDITGAQGWGRVDFMMDDNKNPWLIEVNTVPGMTDHSLVPMAAKQAGLDFERLVVEILAGSFSAAKEVSNVA